LSTKHSLANEDVVDSVVVDSVVVNSVVVVNPVVVVELELEEDVDMDVAVDDIAQSQAAQFTRPPDTSTMSKQDNDPVATSSLHEYPAKMDTVWGVSQYPREVEVLAIVDVDAGAQSQAEQSTSPSDNDKISTQVNEAATMSLHEQPANKDTVSRASQYPRVDVVSGSSVVQSMGPSGQSPLSKLNFVQ